IMERSHTVGGQRTKKPPRRRKVSHLSRPVLCDREELTNLPPPHDRAKSPLATSLRARFPDQSIKAGANALAIVVTLYLSHCKMHSCHLLVKVHEDIVES